MSLSLDTIRYNRQSKRNVSFSTNSIIGRFMKYLGGNNLVYKNFTIEDSNGSTYTQLYNVDGTTTTDSDINVNATIHQYGYELLPKFSIVMFSGTIASIPAGWLLCNGQTATVNGVSVTPPDLRGRFVLSYGQGPLNFANTTLGATGGEQNHTLSVTEMPSHDHDLYSINDDFNSSGTYSNYQKPSMAQFDSSGNITWTNAIESVGGGQAHNNMQPFLALSYIIKYSNNYYLNSLHN